MDPNERSTSQVAEIGESGLIDLIERRSGPVPIGELWAGDDAAIVATGPLTLVTTDVLVEGVDFDLGYCSGFDVGWKSLAVNVSDIAAMGGRPTRAVVALSLPPATPVSVVQAFLDGLESASRRWEVGIVGGDISRADEISVAVTVLGEIDSEPVLRSGARPGDAICVTGALGGAAGGLLALRRGLTGRNAEIDRLVSRQLRPEARLREADALRSATSMIDVSDGLALDLTRLMRASGTGCDVRRDLIPVDPGLAAIDGGPDPMSLALTGGEDFELLCTIAPSDLDRTEAALEAPLAGLTKIGVVTDGGWLLDGEPIEGKELGWDHLRSR